MTRTLVKDEVGETGVYVRRFRPTHLARRFQSFKRVSGTGAYEFRLCLNSSL
jgi:hypothetical protein